MAGAASRCIHVSRTIRIGITPCPNDTFAFHGLLSGAVRVEGIELAIELADIEEQNRALLRDDIDITKASYAAAIAAAGDVFVLPAGSALGFGVGPILLAAREGLRPESSIREEHGRERAPRVLLPGEHTTASFLYRLFHGEAGDVEHVVFSRILPRLVAGSADLGVCIHEARFTWRDLGLHCVEDLGSLWEERTRAPLPLGGLIARRRIGASTALAISAAIRRSIEHARAHPEQALATMRAHAQEQSDAVLWKHVELYVNEWTVDLGPLGARAIETYSREARRLGVIAPDAPALSIAGAREPA
jgi:1,4-dihydroxy-6-naphthoate synthase